MQVRRMRWNASIAARSQVTTFHSYVTNVRLAKRRRRKKKKKRKRAEMQVHAITEQIGRSV